MLKRPASLLSTCVFGLAAATFSAEAQAPIDMRVALVIGNAAYAGAPLLNPANDAKAMGAALRDLGFTVIEARDASKGQMEAAIGLMRETLKGKHGIGMLYYAGHGMQLDWRNYMVPVDARLGSAAEVPAQTVDVQAVLDAFIAAGNRMNILVLDACRDNPFPASASAKGLAPVDAPPGTFLAYATAPGNVAEDGSVASANGLYTQYLLRELKTPDAKIEDVFKRVRLEVRRESAGRQIPWESTSLEEDFSFNASSAPARISPSDDARQAQAELAGWERVKGSTAAADFVDYLLKYPSGRYAEMAQFRLDQLQQRTVLAQPGFGEATPLAPGAWRFHRGDVNTYNLYENFAQRQITGTSRREVTAADDRLVVIEDKAKGWRWEADQMGTILRDRDGVKTPGELQIPAELQVGRRWKSDYISTPHRAGPTRHHRVENLISAREKVSVPAGVFDVFRIDSTATIKLSDGGLVYWTNVAWVDAAQFFVVREEWSYRRVGKDLQSNGRELIALERATR